MSMPGAEQGLRLAEAADLGAVVAITGAAYAHYTDALGAPPVPITEDYRPRVAAGQVWLLDVDGGPAGLIVLERHADHLVIFSVAVAPKYQGKKLGSRLLRFAEDQAREAGLGRVTLYTNARMEKNIALYTASGYRETSRRAHPIRPGWVLVDMEKALA